MSHRRAVFFGSLMVAVMILAACGRSDVVSNATDGGLDGSGDGPPPCTPSCTKICAMEKSCGIITATQVSACESKCSADPSAPEVLCMAQLVCKSTMDCTAAKQCISNPTVPDLTVTHSASSPSAGQIQYKATVCNNGSGAASTFRVHFYRNRSIAPTAGEYGDRTFQLTSLAAGACRTVTLTDTGLSAGSYNTWSQVDADKAVVEISESNNVYGPYKVAVSGTTTKLPDLIVQNLTVVPGPSGYTTFHVTACNYGQGATATTSRYQLYFNSSSSPGPYTTVNRTFTVAAGFSPGSCTNFKASATFQTGTYYAWARADNGNQIKESNESNNTFGPVVYKVGSTLKVPDLVFSMVSSSVSPNGVVTYKGIVVNKGQGAATKGFYVGLFYNLNSGPVPNNKADKQIYMGSYLAPGGSIPFSWSVQFKPGVYTSWARVDDTAAITEIYEWNNTYGPMKFTVTGGSNLPDLVVQKLTASTSSSGLVTFQAYVCNLGKGAAPYGSYLWLYTHRSSSPTPYDKPDKELGLGSMAGGFCKTMTWQTYLKAGTYLAWAMVDGKNVVKESNEYNNVYGSVKYTVSGGPNLPDLVISKMGASQTPTGSVTYTIVACNKGNAMVSAYTYLNIYAHSATKPSIKDKPSAQIYLGYSISAGNCVTRTWSTNLKPGATYLSWALVDGTNAVTESNENNNTFGPLKVTVGGTTKLPDLVTSLKATSSSSGVVTYSASVCNKGSGTASGSFRLYLYVHSYTKPGASTAGSKQFILSSLAAGACKTSTWKVTLKAGTYYSWAQVDALKQIKESNENNNFYGPLTVTVGGTTKLPDLVVTGMKALPGPTGVVTYGVTVCNKGAAAANNVLLRLYVNSNTKPGASTPYSKQYNLGSFAVGTCKNAGSNISLKPGAYASWALVDPQNSIKESNENNNAYGPVKFTVGTTTNKADLYIASIKLNATSSYTYFYVQVCNKGKVAVPYAKVDLYYNRSTKPTATVDGDQTSYVYNLNPGACQQRNFYTVLTPGTYASWAYVDRTNSVPESNETNNVFGPLKHTVAGTGKPDLQIISLTSSQTSTYVYYYITVCNKGTAKSGNTFLDLYYNRSSAPPASLAGNNTTTMYALNPGACQTRTMYAGLPGGTYKSWVRVDRTNVVYESNENNNLYGPVTVKVTGTGKPDLVVTNVSFASNTSGYHYYYVTLCNKGNATAVSTKLEVYYNRSTKPPASLTGDYTSYTGTLYAGACATRTVYAALSAGSYTSWIYVDRTNAVLESNEANNIYGPVKVTVGGGGAPDLQISAVKPYTTPTGYFYYYVTVCNNGKGTAATSVVDVYYNRSSAPSVYTPGNRTTYVPQLAAGACSTRTVYALNLPSGTLTSWARVDRTNAVKESNENNNLYGPMKIVNGTNKPDLRVTQLKANPGPSGYTNYAAMVCNYGKASSASTTVDIYYNLPYPPGPTHAGNTSVTVSALGAGQCSQVNRTVQLKAGTYNSWARVDRINKVAESNEANNYHGPYKFTVSGSTIQQCNFVCNRLVNACGLPSSQFAMCISYCGSMSQAKKDCAYKAAQAKNCNGIMGCL